jgi:hypothetical protein
VTASPAGSPAGSSAGSPAGSSAAGQSADGDEGGTTRTTLRLPDAIKAQVETAAAREGISVNTWLVRAATLALAARPEPTDTPTNVPGSNRVTGWVR